MTDGPSQQEEHQTHQTHGECDEHVEAAGGHRGHHAAHGHRTHRFDPANAERLVSETRRQLIDPDDTLRAAGIAPGHVVIDLGCGPGFFTLPAADLAGGAGKVFAVDVQPQMLELVRRRAVESGKRTVEIVLSHESDVPLASEIADRVFIAFVLHETDSPAAFLQEARRLLRPGGEVAVVEWQKQPETPGPPLEHRIAPQEVRELAVSSGLRPVEERALNEHHYLVRLTR
jgi:ubiquinone/menaquinone biosynthesis C-methylase UbiE